MREGSEIKTRFSVILQLLLHDNIQVNDSFGGMDGHLGTDPND